MVYITDNRGNLMTAKNTEDAFRIMCTLVQNVMGVPIRKETPEKFLRELSGIYNHDWHCERPANSFTPAFPIGEYSVDGEETRFEMTVEKSHLILTQYDWEECDDYYYSHWSWGYPVYEVWVKEKPDWEF